MCLSTNEHSNSHTGCTLARLILMYNPAPDASTDPQWANTPPNTLAMVEMNVGIMAACLVVMRPIFAAIYDRTFKPVVDSVLGSSRGGSWNEKYARASSTDAGRSQARPKPADSNKSGTQVDPGLAGIMKSTDIEMDSRHAGFEEDILRKPENPFRPRDGTVV